MNESVHIPAPSSRPGDRFQRTSQLGMMQQLAGLAACFQVELIGR
jgi:hypothetical protein